MEKGLLVVATMALMSISGFFCVYADGICRAVPSIWYARCARSALWRDGRRRLKRHQHRQFFYQSFAHAHDDRTAQYLSALGNQVDMWEIGNEVNGNWTGAYSDVSAKIYDAWQQVHAAGKRSELTLSGGAGA